MASLGWLIERVGKRFLSQGIHCRSGRSLQVIAAGILCFAVVFSPVSGQSKLSGELPSSTEDRTAGPGWWPTKATASAHTFVGDSACGQCHSEEASTQPDSTMAKAGIHGVDPNRSGELLAETFENGPYTYRFLAQNPGLALEVKSGEKSIAAGVDWTFGAGIHGQTYVLNYEGTLYESQVSRYSSTHHLDLTLGHSQPKTDSLQSALGNPLTAPVAAQCFACHTTAWSDNFKLDLKSAIPGVHCEACHGPGREHIDAVTAGQLDRATKAILNPAHLTPTSSIDFCGACHHTMMDVILNPREHGLISVRYQPYRLEKSRCWEATQDARLTCIACHNPHKSRSEDAASYDKACLSCHSGRTDVSHGSSSRRSTGTAKVCPKATASCTSCHMPKYEIPAMHSQFTDHFIRVVRTGEVFPN